MKYYFYLLSLITLWECSSSKKSCFRDQIINHEFKDVSGLTLDENTSFRFTDTSQTTFKDGNISAEALVVWPSCNEYHLIVRKANYTGGLKVGDTLKVKIQSQKADTFYYEASAYGLTLSSMFKRIK